MTPSWVVRERVACPFTAQMPRNSATELSTTSFFLIILAGKGDIPEVVDQLKPLEDLHFHLNHENGNGRERLETRPPHPSGSQLFAKVFTSRKIEFQMKINPNLEDNVGVPFGIGSLLYYMYIKR